MRTPLLFILATVVVIIFAAMYAMAPVMSEQAQEAERQVEIIDTLK